MANKNNSNEACTSLTVIQEYPSGGETWMIYDCLEYMAVPSGASIVYETLPSGVPSTSKRIWEQFSRQWQGTFADKAAL